MEEVIAGRARQIGDAFSSQPEWESARGVRLSPSLPGAGCVRARVSRAAGRDSGPCSGAPQAPTNFLATKSGATITVVWEPPAAGAAPTGYVLRVAGAFVGELPTTGRTLGGAVGPGTYQLSVRATNS